MKKIICLLLCMMTLLCACDARDEVWGTYLNEDGSASVEFAYSKVFYTLDTAAAASDDAELAKGAVIEGWYHIHEDTVECSFKVGEEKHVYTFRIEGTTLITVGYTVDGEDRPYETEEFKQ